MNQYPRSKTSPHSIHINRVSIGTTPQGLLKTESFQTFLQELEVEIAWNGVQFTSSVEINLISVSSYLYYLIYVTSGLQGETQKI